MLEIAGFRTQAHADHALDLVAACAARSSAWRAWSAPAAPSLPAPSSASTVRSAAQLRLDGRPVAIAAPRDAIDRGIFLVPEDRKRSGLVLDFSVTENISLANLERLRRAACSSAAAPSAAMPTERSAALDIRTASVDTLVGTLSGGNQQKVVLAKWLSMTPRVVIFDEPTRGIDVGSKSEIYRLMRGLADAGVAVLMISSDMEEVIGVSDRIVVMREGRIARLPRARPSSARRT